MRSVLGAETLGLADACDAEIVIHHDLKQMLWKTQKIQILAALKSGTLFSSHNIGSHIFSAM